MPICFRFTSISSTGGETIDVSSAGVTCVVGGNNVGKSQLLRELRGLAYERSQAGGVVVSAAEAVRPTGDTEDSLEWLESRAVKYDSPPGEPKRYAMRIGDNGTTLEGFHFWVNSHEDSGLYLGNIAPFFVEHAAAGTLSSYAAGFINPQFTGERNYALMKLRGSGELEATLSAVIREAFGTGIVLDRLDVQTQLRVGEIESEIPPLNRPSDEYARELAALPTLDSQGDGFRSFVGIASQILTHRFDVLMLDEPEAFLHPGQSRILGRWIAEQAAARNMQVITATHDRDFVIGLLSAGDSSAVSLLRLTRDKSGTHFMQLSPESVSKVWSQPVLRYSNVLQGLFHRKVIVCESDADCRFYGAALERVAVNEGKRSIADDTLFVPASGKNGMPGVLSAVARLGVETWAFPDFDVLQIKQDVKRIVEELGGDWDAAVDDLYMRFIKEPNGSQLWTHVKHSGLNALPPGDSYEAGEKLLDRLTAMRVHVVPRGEMESFAKQIDLHGSAWVSAALEAGVHESSDVADYVRPALNENSVE